MSNFIKDLVNGQLEIMKVSRSVSSEVLKRLQANYKGLDLYHKLIEYEIKCFKADEVRADKILSERYGECLRQMDDPDLDADVADGLFTKGHRNYER